MPQQLHCLSAGDQGKTEKYVYSQEWYENRYQPGICKSHENYIYGMGGGANIMTNDDCAS